MNFNSILGSEKSSIPHLKRKTPARVKYWGVDIFPLQSPSMSKQLNGQKSSVLYQSSSGGQCGEVEVQVCC